MHYRNGREAHNGDKVVLLPPRDGKGKVYGNVVAGILYDATPGNDFCNGKIAPVAQNDPCPNLKECLHMDDFLAAIPPEVADTSSALGAFMGTFRVGDAVSLKSGGPPMIVTAVDAVIGELSCAWQDAKGANVERGRFPGATVVAVPAAS